MFSKRASLSTNTNNPPSIPLASSCPGKVDESSFYIGPYELNANSISDIKSFKPSYQLSFFYYHGPFEPSALRDKIVGCWKKPICCVPPAYR
jgi:hypothetical protein